METRAQSAIVGGFHPIAVDASTGYKFTTNRHVPVTNHARQSRPRFANRAGTTRCRAVIANLQSFPTAVLVAGVGGRLWDGYVRHACRQTTTQTRE